MSENIRDRNGDKVVRIGLLSRIDFGSDGFRQGLLELAAERFAAEDVAFVVLAGGLVSGKAVADKTRILKKEHQSLVRQIKAKQQEIDEIVDTKRIAHIEKEIAKLKRDTQKVTRQLAALTPEEMAKTLNTCLPHFKDGQGRPIKLYFVPSPVYDKAIGEETAVRLVDLRKQGAMRVLKTGGDRLPLWEGKPHQRNLEVLTLDKQAWLRGDYHSTPVQRRIKDKRRQTSSGVQIDIQVVGSVGVSIMKPEGNWPIGFVAVPALHRLDDTGVAETQVGVQVLEIEHARRNPTLRSYSFKDMLSHERSFIGMPQDPSPKQKICLEVLRRHGRSTTGFIAGEVRLSKEDVSAALKPLLATKYHKRYKTWPGLVYDELSDRWDFDLSWVQRELRYGAPQGELKRDIVVAICCIHAGSRDTDYKHFLTEVPRVMLERGAKMLVSAGDHVEGTSHDMLMKDEIILGLDNTRQERLAAHMIATVLYKVFQARFDAAVKTSVPKKREEITALVDEALPMFRYVPGNHCGWISRAGVQPLATMVREIEKLLTQWIEEHLASKNLFVDRIMRLVGRHVETVGDGKFTLPSGVRMGMTHPHMGGSETISSSAQKALMLYRDCQAVVIGNFHTAVVVEEWDQKLGQRVCIQIPTMKHGSPFEHSKLKTVDQGFGVMEVDSIRDRIVGTRTTFYSNDKIKPGEKRWDSEKPFQDFLDQQGMKR